MRLPGTILQGILARAALVFLRVYLGVVLMVRGLGGAPEGLAALLPTTLSWGLVVVGIALLLGFLTRFSAAIVLVLSLRTAMEGGRWDIGGNHMASAAISMALLVGAAGRTAGVDAALARRWPRSPFW
jgi:hypothetical protein